MSSAETLEEELVAAADRLYALAPDAFVAARDAEARAAATKELAGRIKALRRPSLAAWAVNLLVRREGEQIDQVLALAVALRSAAASLDGEELRALTRQRRQLTAALTVTARTLAGESGVRLTSAVADQVEGVLTAAMLDPLAAEIVRSGMLLTAFTATGVDEIDVASVCALPAALGHRATPSNGPAAEALPPPMLRVVPDTAVRLEAAREQVQAAVLELARAREEVTHRSTQVTTLQARRLQLLGELAELQRRIADLEGEVERVDSDLDDAVVDSREAAGLVEAAEQDLLRARSELARLEG